MAKHRLAHVLMAVTSIAFAAMLLSCSEMEPKWSREFDALGPGYYRINSASCIKDDIYLTGSFRGSSEQSKCFTAKYSSEGVLEWYTVLDAGEIEEAEGKVITAVRTQIELLVPRSDIHVLAQAQDKDAHQKVILVKYDSTGNVQWQNTVTTHDGILTSTLLSDAEGNVYVAGCERDQENKPTIYIGKYDEAGKTVWFTKYYNDFINYEQVMFDIVQPGFVVAAGILKNTGELFCMRYGSDGQFLGIARHDKHLVDFALAGVKAGPDGRVYVTGTMTNAETDNDFLTVAFDGNDNLLWAKHYDGEAHKSDHARAIAVDDSLSVYVCGSSERAEGVNAIVCVKYDQDGNIAWDAALGEKRPAEPVFIDPTYIHTARKSETVHFHIAGVIDDDAAIIRCNLNGFYSSSRKYGRRGMVTRPTAFSGTCMALECVGERTAEARLVKFGPTAILGIARWD